MKVATIEMAAEMKILLNSESKEPLKNNMMQGDGMMEASVMKQCLGVMMQNRDGMIQNQNKQ